MSSLNINNVSTLNFSSPGGGSGTGYIAQQYGTSGALLISDTVGILNKAPSVVLQTPTGNTTYALNDTGATITQPGSMVINSPAITLSTATISCPGLLSISSLNVSSTTLVGGSIATNEKGLTWSQTGSISTTWTAISPECGSTALGVYFAVVNGGYIYYTTNNGATWTQQATVQAWSAITTNIAGTIGIASVAGGGIYYTSDSGTTWTLSASAPTANWSGVSVSYYLTGYFFACVNGGGIYISTNNGVTWAITDAPTKNWTAINNAYYDSFAICSGSTSPLYRGGASTGWVAPSGSSSIPSGNWNSISVIGWGAYDNASPTFVLIGRNDGSNYSWDYQGSATQTTVTALSVRGYVGQLRAGGACYSALPNNPIQVSYNRGITWLTSFSPSLNWSCISPSAGYNPSPTFGLTNNQNQTVNSMMVGTTSGYIWKDLPNSTNTYTNIIAGHNTSIGSDGVVNVNGSEVNLYGNAIISLTGRNTVVNGGLTTNGNVSFNGNGSFNCAILATFAGAQTAFSATNTVFQGITNFTGGTTTISTNTAITKPLTFSGATATFNTGTVTFTGGTTTISTITAVTQNATFSAGVSTRAGISYGSPTNTTILVRQPFIQYSTISGSGASGTATVTMPYAYTSQASYLPFANMIDSPSAQIFVSSISASQFIIGWTSAGVGTQHLAWNTMGT